MTNYVRRRRRRGSGGPARTPNGVRATASLDREGQALQLPKSISVKHLADQMDEDPINVIKGLIRIGVMANINQVVDFNIAAAVATELGFEVSPLTETRDGTDAQVRLAKDEDPASLMARPPVVTILGHVDHG
ncbi:MAG: translation initiation factor IF-2 N-terminal domain-containing protein, partial [Chloroflexi bacterium]|nr:translation initiation factor IF-2 N-terminal domain-containing protein [Chloroflexota bacterium]